MIGPKYLLTPLLLVLTLLSLLARNWNCSLAVPGVVPAYRLPALYP